jgi:hypothetical protein
MAPDTGVKFLQAMESAQENAVGRTTTSRCSNIRVSAIEPDWSKEKFSVHFRLQHIAPGRAEGKGGVNQADVGIGLGEVPELEPGFRHKVLRNEADAVGAGEALIHDLSGFR